MTKEQLIALGMTEAQADAALKLHKDAIDGNYVPKATFEAERDKVKATEKLVTERDTQITELGKFKGTAEDLTKKVGELEEKNKTDKANYDAEVTRIQNENAVKSVIGGMVHDVGDVISKLDITKVVFKDGAVVSGLTEQVDALKKDKPHYFKPEEKPNTGGFSGIIIGKTPAQGTDDKSLTGDKDIDFGKQLASSRTSSATMAEKAKEAYFK